MRTCFLIATCFALAFAGTTGIAQSVFSLFDGTNTMQWVPASAGTGPISWTIKDGALQVVPGTGSIETFQYFQDFELHLEFRCPATPEGTPEQSRGNSGVYLQNATRFKFSTPTTGLCLVRTTAPRSITSATRTRMSRVPQESWQTYDILFRAARWNGATKIEQARVSVTWNGTLVHSNIAIPGLTGSGLTESSAPGPIFLQDHGDLVQFSNVWIRPINPAIPSAPQGLTALADKEDIRLFWSAVPDRASYNVRRATNSSGPFTMLAPFVQEPAFLDVAAGPGPWYYTISAVKEGTEGPECEPVFGSPTLGPTFIEVIPVGTNWKYLDDGSNQGTAWRLSTFDDSSWREGRAKLGYGDGNEVTLIRSNRSDGTRIITTYFRHRFVVMNVWQMTNLTVNLLRDDGGVVYLNGTEVFRSNMPSTPINYLTPATNVVGGADEMTFYSTNINSSLLLEGTNVLAVEIHQSSTTSSDVGFNLSLTGVRAPLPVLVITRSEDLIDMSWPATPDGFHLERTHGLSPTRSWTWETNLITLSGTNHFRVTPAGDAFYRLARP